MSIRLSQLVDVSTFGPSGYGLTAQKIYGARVAVEWVARAWLSPRGALRWSPGIGISILDLENSTHDRTTIASWKAALVGAAEEVEFVHSATAEISLSDRTITITSKLLLVDGRTYRLAVTLADGAALVTLGSS